MLWFRPGNTLVKEFTTSSSTNGQSVDADSLPTVVLSRNGTVDAAVTVAVVLVETGRYSASCEIPSDYNPGDLIVLRLAATVGSISGRDTLFETRLIGIDLTQEIADQLFVDGIGSKLKVNVDNSVNGEVVLSPESLAEIANQINASTLTANQIAAALAGTTSVMFVGSMMTGESHRLVRGSAYLHANGLAPFVRVAKALYNLSGATAEFRMKLVRETAVTATATIISFDADYYEIYADLASTKTDDLKIGTGHDQFWVTLSDGSKVAVSDCYLEVIEGIGVA